MIGAISYGISVRETGLEVPCHLEIEGRRCAWSSSAFGPSVYLVFPIADKAYADIASVCAPPAKSFFAEIYGGYASQTCGSAWV